MKNEYTQEQISEAIEYWKGKLAEKEAETPVPVEETDAVGKVGKAAKAVGKFIAGDVKQTLADMQASLFKTKGMKDFVKIMADNQKNKGKDSYHEQDKFYFAISLADKFYNVVDIELLSSKDSWFCNQPAIGLVTDFDKPMKKENTLTVASFAEALKKADVKPANVSSTYSTFLLANANKAAAKGAATSPDDLGGPEPTTVSEAETSDLPLAEPAVTPEGYAVYLKNPFVKVYTVKDWIVFVFDQSKAEKKAAADKIWG